VARGEHLRSQRRPPLDLLADHEERGTRARECEKFEDGRSALRVWPVVESERDARSAAQRAWQPKCLSGSRQHRSKEVTNHAGNDREAFTVRGFGSAEARLTLPEMKPDLDHWLPEPAVRIVHRRESSASPDRLWQAALSLKLVDTSLLGRLVRWRIPGTSLAVSFEELFRNPPFIVLHEQEQALVSGIVGRIWTLRRDYPQLRDPEQFRGWSSRGTARVVFASWVEPVDGNRSALASESRVQPIGTQGRLGLSAVRPVIKAFHHLVGSDGIEAAVRLAERR
jgi:hypothetical protein